MMHSFFLPPAPDFMIERDDTESKVAGATEVDESDGVENPSSGGENSSPSTEIAP